MGGSSRATGSSNVRAPNGSRVLRSHQYTAQLWLHRLVGRQQRAQVRHQHPVRRLCSSPRARAERPWTAR
jgi:hypothetical protein